MLTIDFVSVLSRLHNLFAHQSEKDDLDNLARIIRSLTPYERELIGELLKRERYVNWKECLQQRSIISPDLHLEIMCLIG